MHKNRKKGSAIVEFLVVIPIFMLLIWGILQLMLYMTASSTTHEASLEAARILTMEMRGDEEAFPSPTSPDPVQVDKYNLLADKLKIKIDNVVDFNKFVLLFRDENGVECTESGRNLHDPAALPAACPLIVMKTTLNDSCLDVLAIHEKVVCATVMEKNAGTGREQQQVLVYIKSDFHVIGSFAPGLTTLKIKAKGSSQKELTDRFQYYEPTPKCYYKPGTGPGGVCP